MERTVQNEIKNVIVFVAAIWIVFLLEFIPGLNLLGFGVTPRTARGFVGIVAMPFLHIDWRHITSNTPALFVLLILLAGSTSRSWIMVVEIVLLSGALLWLFGRSATHIGASGLIFGLIAFLMIAGLRQRKIVPFFVAVIVGFLYGGSLLTGMIPRFGSHTSWDGHLLGALAGGIVAFTSTANPKRQQTNDE